MKIPLLVLAAFALAGCAGTPGRIALESSEQLKSEKTLNLCGAYGANGGAGVMAELKRRDAIRDKFDDAIAGRRGFMGMNQCEIAAAWGRPDTIHRFAAEEHPTVVWMYKNKTGQSVSFTDGIATSVQGNQ